MRFERLLGYNIDTSLEELNFVHNNRLIVNTINPHSYCEAKKDPLFSEALHKSDLLLPDGIGIVWAIKFMTKRKIKRIPGADLHKYLLKKCNEISGKVYYMGSSEYTLSLIEERLKREYPNIRVKCFSPPYKNNLEDEDNRLILSDINAFSPEILFIGMTAPKQEKWAYQHKELLDANIIASIGAVFDFYAGTIKRPDIIWQKLGLEWMVRFLKEPRRLWQRNFISTPCFIWDVLIAKIRKTK